MSKIKSRTGKDSNNRLILDVASASGKHDEYDLDALIERTVAAHWITTKAYAYAQDDVFRNATKLDIIFDFCHFVGMADTKFCEAQENLKTLFSSHLDVYQPQGQEQFIAAMKAIESGRDFIAEAINLSCTSLIGIRDIEIVSEIINLADKCFSKNLISVKVLIAEAFTLYFGIENYIAYLSGKDVITRKFDREREAIVKCILSLSEEDYLQVAPYLKNILSDDKSDFVSKREFITSYGRDGNRERIRGRTWPLLSEQQVADVNLICKRWDSDATKYRGRIFDWLRENMAQFIPGLTQGHLRVNKKLYSTFDQTVRRKGLPDDLDIPTEWAANMRQAQRFSAEEVISQRRAEGRQRDRTYRHRRVKNTTPDLT